MVRYPIRAYKALGFLKRNQNDIEIYVEDTTCHNMHLFIYRNILGEKVRLQSVNQVGNRDRVIGNCSPPALAGSLGSEHRAAGKAGADGGESA